MSNHIQNIAIVGAGGSLGSEILAAILAQSPSLNFKVKIITRPGSSILTSAHSSNSSITFAVGDYDDHSFLVGALTGQEVLIIALGFTASHKYQPLFIKAAAEAKVQYVLPTEFGSDTTNPKIIEYHPSAHEKVAARKLVEELGVSSWIAIICSSWYDWNTKGGYFGIDIKAKRAVLFDGGEQKTVLSTIPFAALATAKVLSLPKTAMVEGKPSLEWYRNKPVFVNCFRVSQKDMLASIQKVVGAGGWEISQKPTMTHYTEGKERLAKGDFMGILNLLSASQFMDGVGTSLSGPQQKEILGLPPVDFDETTRQIVEDVLASEK
ncbi:hypothetical protein PV08_02754 [Exophiala spinifera]|uniref:NmrA-like domain-containing protein n=1 Tax=Exophiala spinifera TaxID=91928 RepID=A0A0D1YT52_9EURO|nr:uncharacterized protein PV08_02754 [Exophiala spinifera]KIW18466.1 hypothetical protein PV08_02754 [Exophiala spinifera]